ncbi:MAG: ATP-binding protein [Actinoplanes sp.]
MRARDSAADAGRLHLDGRLLAAAVVLVGLIVTGLFYVGLRVNQRETAERVMDQRTDMAEAAVQTEARRYLSLLEATAAGIAIDPSLTWEDFDSVTAPLNSAKLIGASSVSYIVPSSTDAIPAVQRHWRSRGAEGLQLRPAGGNEHYFSIFTRALHATALLNGLDAAGSADAVAAMDEARRMSQVTVSDTYVLLRDRELPAAEQQLSFTVAAPVWTRAAAPDFLGWMVLGMRGQDFLSGVLDTVSQGQLDAELLVTDRDGGRPTVAQVRVDGDADLERQRPFTVADRDWTLIVRADTHRLPGARSNLPPAVLGSGIMITLILAGLVLVLATGRSRARLRVQEATAELRVAESESRRQAGLLGAIMTSISDGVGVVDETGAFLLHNPAAKEMLGIGPDEDDPQNWQEHYGLYRPDGRTPFPVEETPLIRALHGESSNNVEMIIRNRNRPEGVLISFDGRPLDPSAGQVGAVAVYHDITELRRYENDLAVFAGVVAHDLKAPLAVIRGHCEAAVEDLAEAPAGPEVTEAAGGLERIIRAVDRMAGLIETLLAYSTARDAPLRTEPVDLGALTAEVVQDRTAHLRPENRPAVRLGPLPPVQADPAMLRHVLDNLIGNAFKYIRPGTVAQVEITAGPAAPGEYARIEVADRGIGIPEPDKADVFDSFHRAETAAGYAGTGLGLAICKRIVERHGGEIGVADNPGGGTLMHFTLPVTILSEETTMHEDDEAATRARLERALAERSAMENSRLPGLSALPAADPSGHEEAAARLRAPVPDHHPSSAASAD